MSVGSSSHHKLVLPSAALLALLLALFVYWINKRHPTPVAPERRDAPAFALTTLQGAPLTLKALRGKVVLVDFWATWCSPCRDEIPQLIKLQKQYAARGLQIVGISMDNRPEPVQAFYAAHGMNYPVAIGSVTLAQRFGGVLGMPVKFLIDRQGGIVSKHVGAVDFDALEHELAAQLDR